MSLGRRGYDVVLAEADNEVGGRVVREARLPGLAAWIRVVDYRKGQLARLRNVELALGSQLTADEILSYDFEHVAVATGSRWRADGVGRVHTRPLALEATEILTPDDLLAGARPAGEQVVLFDDDHYYMGGVLAELLAVAGHRVTLVTREPRVSEWTVNTMEQHRIQRTATRSGRRMRSPRTSLVAADGGTARVACSYTDTGA